MARKENNCTVFHLMGGAPALQLKHWPELLDALDAEPPGWVFHSDLMLSESVYNPHVIDLIAHPRALYAVDIKGLTPEEHLRNTRKPLNMARIWQNLDTLEDNEVQFYFTFTACAPEGVEAFWNSYARNFGEARALLRERESFAIDLIDYDATPYVDQVPWGWDGKTETPHENS